MSIASYLIQCRSTCCQSILFLFISMKLFQKSTILILLIFRITNLFLQNYKNQQYLNNLLINISFHMFRLFFFFAFLTFSLTK